MEITGKFKTEFEAWLKDNGYAPKYLEVMKEYDKKPLLKRFIKSVGLNQNDIQKAIEIFNEYYANI